VLGAKSFFIDGEIATLDIEVSRRYRLVRVSGELNQHPDGDGLGFPIRND
jgi:hypothetical protein